ncbi:MAG: methyltransferase domain-containing protein [Candidatus Omnitrophica bacterium]|nr:methyltransferase domain-containing protein [Candidatus Omnitrophota bacterium]
MRLSVVIPIHNEEEQIERVVTALSQTLSSEGIDHEMVAVNDNSQDRTPLILSELSRKIPQIRIVTRKPPAGLGRAIREGLLHVTGDVIVIFMGDDSDSPDDVVRYLRKIEEGIDCVFGSRFVRGGFVKDYPFLKLLVNRLANFFIQCLFFVPENDITNAFKAYRKEVIDAVQPLEAEHFNITVEIPLKAINRGFSRAVIPIQWYGRRSGVSKLTLRVMGRRYLYTVLKAWLEKTLLKGDLYTRPIPQDKAKEKEFFSNWDGGFEIFEERTYQRLLRSFIAEAHPEKAQSVLEVGCGSGAFTKYLCEFGLRVIGVDLTEKLLRIGRERTQGTFTTGDVECLPFKDNQFDIVVAINLLHHMPQMDQMVSEVFRVLKPGGVFYALDPNQRHPAMRFYRDRRSPFYSSAGHSPNERLLTAEEILTHLNRFFESPKVVGISGMTYQWLEGTWARRFLPLYNSFEIAFGAIPLSKKYGAYLVSSARKRKQDLKVGEMISIP